MELYNDLLPDPLPAEPMALAGAWLATALAARQQPNPDSMVLATATASGQPSARVVLCKVLDAELGRVSFVTNYDSRKGRELEENARAALVFHWDHVHRQIRIEGVVVKAPACRERRVLRFAQLAAPHRRLGQRPEPAAALAGAAELRGARRRRTLWRAASHARKTSTSRRGARIPRPPFWGGYYVWADAVELWIEGSARIHERARWTRSLTTAGAGFRAGPWAATRLQP